jgi:hypothetical protein
MQISAASDAFEIFRHKIEGKIESPPFADFAKGKPRKRYCVL